MATGRIALLSGPFGFISLDDGGTDVLYEVIGAMLRAYAQRRLRRGESLFVLLVDDERRRSIVRDFERDTRRQSFP
jgi:hypothetical protein